MPKRRLRTTLGIVACVLVLVFCFFGATAYYHFAWAGRTESVTFKSGDLTIAGLLVKPRGDAPYPAIVVLHGSGRADGEHDCATYRVHANAFVRKGFAVLVYDKRGLGESKGDFSSSTYGDFVADAVAAVRFLRGRNDVAPLRIGLLGTSEGGWLTPEVATTAGDIAFIVNKCGSPLSWQETVQFEIENDLRAGGLAPEVAAEVGALRARMWKYYVSAARNNTLATGAERDALNAELAAIGAKADRIKLGGLPDSLEMYDSALYARLASKYSYDPMPFLQELNVPTLWVFGENDINVPTAKSLAALKQLRQERHRDIAVQVYPGVGHSLMTWKGIASAGYVGGYLNLIGDWAWEHADGR